MATVMLSEAEIKNILKNKEQRLHSLKVKRESIYKELQDQEAYMRSALLAGPKIGERVQQSGVRDVMDDLWNYRRQAKKYEKELKKLLSEITREEEKIQKVWYCFIKLTEPYYTYLYDLYVAGKPYKSVQKESGLAQSTFARYRKRAIETIQMLYDYNSIHDINQWGKDGKENEQ